MAGGFEHVLGLSQSAQLQTLVIDGFWAAFENLPPEIAATRSLEAKLAYLRERLEASAEPLL